MEADPAFVADVLSVANSALFGFRARIQVLRHAIALLGLDRLRALVITVAMRSFVGAQGPLHRLAWQHSVSCGMIAEEISPMFRIRGDSAYTAGLLHDVGRLGLLKSAPAQYSAVLGRSFEDAERLLRAERELMEVDHCFAGGWMVKNWALPAVFVETCERHHDPFQMVDSNLLQVVKLSCRMADGMGFAGGCYTHSLDYDAVIGSLPSDIPRHLLPPGGELQERVRAKLEGFVK